MKISIIAAVARNRVIGSKNRLPWHLPADLRHFMRMTMGHYVLMGRKTFESLKEPLRNRTNVVITRQPEYSPEGVLIAHSLPDAISLAEGEEEVFIAGGAAIYSEALTFSHCIYLTLIHQDFEGDTHFPAFDERAWRLVSRADHGTDEDNPYPFSFLTYERVPPLP